MIANHIVSRFARSSWGRKLAARRTKRRMTDFDRFVAMKVHRGSYFNKPKAQRKAEHLATIKNRKNQIAAKKERLAKKAEEKKRIEKLIEEKKSKSENAVKA